MCDTQKYGYFLKTTLIMSDRVSSIQYETILSQ